MSEGKTQVGWATIVRRKTQRCTKVNNTPPKKSPYCVLNLNEMPMKSSCQEVWNKYSGDGHT